MPSPQYACLPSPEIEQPYQFHIRMSSHQSRGLLHRPRIAARRKRQSFVMASPSSQSSYLNGWSLPSSAGTPMIPSPPNRGMLAEVGAVIAYGSRLPSSHSSNSSLMTPSPHRMSPACHTDTQHYRLGTLVARRCIPPSLHYHRRRSRDLRSRRRRTLRWHLLPARIDGCRRYVASTPYAHISVSTLPSSHASSPSRSPSPQTVVMAVQSAEQ